MEQVPISRLPDTNLPYSGGEEFLVVQGGATKSGTLSSFVSFLSSGPTSSQRIVDSTEIGRSILTANDAASIRTTIGAVSSTDPRLSDARTPTVDGLLTAAQAMTPTEESDMRAAIGAAHAAIIPSGLVSDAAIIDSLNMTAGSAALTSATAQFQAADVGKFIRVRGAGAAGGDLVTTIAARASATSITLTAPAATTVSNAQGVYGTNNSAAIQAAIDAAGASTIQKTVFIPEGRYLCNVISLPSVRIEGARGLDGQSAMTRSKFNELTKLSALVPAQNSPVIRFSTTTGGGANATIERILFVAGDGTLEGNRRGTAIEVGEPLNTNNTPVAAGLELKHCEFNGFFYGVTFSRMWSSVIEACTANFCTVGFFSGEIQANGVPTFSGPADGLIFLTCTTNFVTTCFHILGTKQTAIISGDYNNMSKFLLANSAQVQITGINIETCTDIIFHLVEGGGQSRVVCDHIQGLGTIGVGCRDERGGLSSFSLMSNVGFTFRYQTVSVSNLPVLLPAASEIERFTDTTFSTLRAREFWDAYARLSFEGRDFLRLYEPFTKTQASPFGSLGWVITNIAGTTTVTGQANSLSLFQDAANEAARFQTENVVSNFATNWRLVWRFRCAGGQLATVLRLGLYSQDATANMTPQNGIGLRADTVTDLDTTLKLEVIVGGVKQPAIDTGIPLSGLAITRDLVIEKRGSSVYLAVKETNGHYVGNQVVYAGTMPSGAVPAGPAMFISGSAAQLWYLQRMSFEVTP